VDYSSLCSLLSLRVRAGRERRGGIWKSCPSSPSWKWPEGCPGLLGCVYFSPGSYEAFVIVLICTQWGCGPELVGTAG
jgi:hypothetical protein